LRTDPIRLRIQQALLAGILPRNRGVKVTGSCGVAAVCNCCDSTILAGETRLTITDGARVEAGERNSVVFMHPQCAQIWYAEADVIESYAANV
jgi:hypothetical protein